jgi:calmodulin
VKFENSRIHTRYFSVCIPSRGYRNESYRIRYRLKHRKLAVFRLIFPLLLFVYLGEKRAEQSQERDQGNYPDIWIGIKSCSIRVSGEWCCLRRRLTDAGRLSMPLVCTWLALTLLTLNRPNLPHPSPPPPLKDKDRSHTIDVWELRQVLEAMGQKPTEEELFQMISEVDEDMSGSIDFAEFLKVIENQKERAENFDNESDMIDAFVACGGNPDKSGCVVSSTLVKIIKQDFGLTIDIEELIAEVDRDQSGQIEFIEFKTLLS